MAERYGGKFSPEPKPDAEAPDAPHPWRGKKRTRAGGRVNLLFIAPLPIVARAFFQEPTGLVLDLVAFGLLILAAWLTREGLLAEEAYHARKIAKRPAVPRKLFGAALTGIGLALAGFSPEGLLLNPILFLLLGAVLHFLAFGADPMTDKGAEGIDAFQTERVARAVDEAEKHLKAMSDAIRRAEDRGMERRVEGFQSTVRDLFRTVEEDPRDLTAARKYLSVYLLGARDATAKFADIYARNRDAQARADYAALLDDLEQNFAARTRALLDDNRTDLTIEIEVLRERLAREGVRPE